jgi:hypothetical protein
MISLMRITLSAAAFASLSLPLPASAAEPEACPGLVASRETLFSQAALRQDEVGLTFVGHATFLIETPKGVRIATDYSDGTRPPVTPDVATMNKAHSTHFTARPDPGIRHVLKGWNPAGGPAYHDLTVQDVRIRNVSTNIRSFGGATEYDGNSIFVFETAQLCIAHLGHLHHTLTPSISRSWGASMHFFGSSTLNRFLASAQEHFPVEFSDAPSIVLSRATLPNSPKILVLPGH